jgi:hypothetical protein
VNVVEEVGKGLRNGEQKAGHGDIVEDEGYFHFS